MKLSRFETNSDYETNGVWIDIGDECQLLIARAGGANRKYRDCLNRKMKPYRRQIRSNTMSDDLADRLVTEAIAETVLLGWRGLKDDNDNDIPYSLEKAKQILMDYRDFKELVTELASEQETFREEAMQEDKETLKN